MAVKGIETDGGFSPPPAIGFTESAKVRQLKQRLRKLAGQVERLSWMLDYMEKQQLFEIQSGCSRVIYIGEAERAWEEAQNGT